ncbi:MAG: dihydroxy-acid dehydratase [Pirellulaceae bacterium]
MPGSGRLRHRGVVQYLGPLSRGGRFDVALEQLRFRPRIQGSETSAAVGAVKNLLALGLRPRDILTRKAFENAAVTIAAAGGSTNGVLHMMRACRRGGSRL